MKGFTGILCFQTEEKTCNVNQGSSMFFKIDSLLISTQVSVLVIRSSPVRNPDHLTYAIFRMDPGIIQTMNKNLIATILLCQGGILLHLLISFHQQVFLVFFGGC